MPVSRKAQRSRPIVRVLHALVLVDTRDLQRATWLKFEAARRRLDKATQDLHRHEEIDAPAYESWMHRTFPLLVTKLRELQQHAAAQAVRMQRVQATAYFTGRSVKRVWQEEQTRAKNADFFDPEDDPSAEGAPPGGAGGAGDRFDDGSPPFDLPPSPARSTNARDIYRRLVQRLHPDRGGIWTAARERLWHQVQQAWELGDVDWLARLEIEWESANEILGPSSPLSRLYRAIDELSAARRDMDRKLRDYRKAPAWRFTLNERKRDILQARVEVELQRELGYLRRQVEQLNEVVATWEDDWTQPGHRLKRRRRYS